MLHRERHCYGKSSVRPSVTLRYRGHIGWNTSKIISWLIILIILCFLLSVDPNITDLRQRNTSNVSTFGRNMGDLIVAHSHICFYTVKLK